MKNRAEKFDPVDYLKKVLGEWKEFCKGHERFAEAISEVLAENEMLKARVKQLQSQRGDAK